MISIFRKKKKFFPIYAFAFNIAEDFYFNNKSRIKNMSLVRESGIPRCRQKVDIVKKGELIISPSFCEQNPCLAPNCFSIPCIEVEYVSNEKKTLKCYQMNECDILNKTFKYDNWREFGTFFGYINKEEIEICIDAYSYI